MRVQFCIRIFNCINYLIFKSLYYIIDFMKDITINENRFIELSNKAYTRNIVTHSAFLNIFELEEFAKAKSKFSSNYILTGVVENAERKVAVFFNNEEDLELNTIITCLKVSPVSFKFGEELAHKNYLGALMNLGIERNAIGDILVNGKDAYVMCLTSISEYIIDNLISVNRTVVKVEVIDKIPDSLKIKLQDVSLSAPSNRIDVIISKLYGVSRNVANEMFDDRNVFINDKICSNNSYCLKDDDIVSVRYYGRFCFVGQQQKTKKGNTIYLIKKYVS